MKEVLGRDVQLRPSYSIFASTASLMEYNHFMWMVKNMASEA